MRNNLQRYAKLNSHSDAPKPEENLGTLTQSTEQGETSDTRMTWGTVPHPDFEMEMDKNPKPLSGNRTGHATVSDVVVSPQMPLAVTT